MPNQLPAPGEIFLDHTAFFVAAMDTAAVALERCGFRLTPFTIQTNREGDKTVPSGTGNRCAMLKNGYLEVLAATSDTPLSAQLRERVADHAGLHLAAFASADAAAEHPRLTTSGFPTLPLVDMRRPVKVPGGGDDFARFTIARVAHGTMPEGRAQFLTHHTEPLVWLADMLDHPNTAEALTALWIAAADPAEPAARYARFTGRPARQEGPVTTIALDRGALHIAAPEHLQEAFRISPAGTLPCLAAAAIKVASLVKLQACLAGAGFAHHRFDGGIAVTLPSSLGDALIFHEV
ncbi:MAG TPA: VOC family protein [Stellaceae bacterium]|nr:VOC family protein [Stellaceae bacterium]